VIGVDDAQRLDPAPAALIITPIGVKQYEVGGATWTTAEIRCVTIFSNGEPPMVPSTEPVTTVPCGTYGYYQSASTSNLSGQIILYCDPPSGNPLTSHHAA
jgi:hypothetical protein